MTIADLAATPRTAGVALPTGVRLCYAELGDPAGHAVLLLHGLSDSRRSFDRLLPLLPPSLRLIVPDQRGHGDSDRPDDGYTLPALAADALALLDALGVARATVVGHSLGSFVAQRLALAARERVAGLVLVASASAPDRMAGADDFAGAIAGLGASGDPDGPAPEAFVREFQASTVHVPVPADFMEDVVAASLRLPVRVWQALAHGLLAADDADRGHRLPTLLLWGERDAYMLREEQDALLARLPAATLVTLADTGHAPHWERPVETAAALAPFLARMAAGARPADR